MNTNIKKEIFDRFKVLHSRIICAICHDVASNPIMGPCHHGMCNFCVQKLFGRKSSAPCPMCQQTLQKRSMNQSSKVSGWHESIQELAKAIEFDFGEPYVDNYQPINVDQMHLSQEMTQQASVQNDITEDIIVPTPSGLPPRVRGKLQSSFRKLFPHSNSAKRKEKEREKQEKQMSESSNDNSSFHSLFVPPGRPLRSSSTLTINAVVETDEKDPKGSKMNLSKRLSGSMSNLMSALKPGSSKKQKVFLGDGSTSGLFNVRVTPRKGTYGVEEGTVAMSKKNLLTSAEEEDCIVGERSSKQHRASRRGSAVQLISITPLHTEAPIPPILEKKVTRLTELGPSKALADTSITLENIKCQNCNCGVQIPIENIHSLSLELANLSGLEISLNSSKRQTLDMVDEAIQVEPVVAEPTQTPLSQVGIIPDTVMLTNEPEPQPIQHGSSPRSVIDVPEPVTSHEEPRPKSVTTPVKQNKEPYIKKSFNDYLYKMVVSLGEGSPGEHILKSPHIIPPYPPNEVINAPETLSEVQLSSPPSKSPDEDETQFTRNLLESVQNQEFTQLGDQSKDQIELDRVLLSLGLHHAVVNPNLPVPPLQVPSEDTVTQVASAITPALPDTPSVIPDTIPGVTAALFHSPPKKIVKKEKLSVECSQVFTDNRESLLKVLNRDVEEPPPKEVPLETATSKTKTLMSPLATINQNIPITPSIQRRMAITTSGLTREEMHIVRDFLQRFHGEYNRSFQPGVTTHVVMHTLPNEPRQCERTLKYFLGILTKSWLVSVHWCKESLDDHRLHPEIPYEIQGDVVWGSSFKAPTRSRESISDSLMQNFALVPSMVPRTCRSDLFRQWIIGVIEPLGQLNKEEAEILIDCSGGEFLSSPAEIAKVSRKNKNKRVLLTNTAVAGFSISTCKAIYSEFKIPIVHLEWMLDSISKYEVQPVTKENAVWPKKITSL